MIPIPGWAVLESIECLWSLFVGRVMYGGMKSNHGQRMTRENPLRVSRRPSGETRLPHMASATRPRFSTSPSTASKVRLTLRLFSLSSPRTRATELPEQSLVRLLACGRDALFRATPPPPPQAQLFLAPLGLSRAPVGSRPCALGLCRNISEFLFTRFFSPAGECSVCCVLCATTSGPLFVLPGTQAK
jgi:hypothetical protein